MTKDKIIAILGVVAGVAILAAVYFVGASRGATEVKQSATGNGYGAVGNMLAEDYIPYVQYNQGFNTAKGITNSGAFTQSGASTISGAVSLTSSLTVGSSGTALTYVKSGTCVMAPGARVIIGSFEKRTINCGSGNNGETAISGLGAQHGDKVFMTLATTTTVAQNSLFIVSAGVASSTDFLSLQLMNASSSPVTLTSNATSSLDYLILR